MLAVGTQRTIHQRNKSSPALSTMLQPGGLKAAAKRTAFGDVSNMANIARPYKDDLAISAKGDLKLKENLPPTQPDKKTTTFQKPAQRPVSVSGLKALLQNGTTLPNPLLVKQPLIEIHQPSQPSQPVAPPVNTRKIATKKSTAVFQDNAAIQAEEVSKPQPLNAPVAPVHRELLPRQLSQPAEDAIELQQNLRRTHSKYLDAPEVGIDTSAHSSTQPPSEEEPAMRSDGVYIDSHGQLQSYDYLEPVNFSDHHVEIADPASILPSSMHLEATYSRLDQLLSTQPAQPLAEPARKHRLAPVSEPEEYWEEEDAADNYDEEGYVTARSFRSRGDNTTGGATTILFPKVTQKVKKEFALAKELIEGSKTAEELEDEAWDTTMVAEYGDEIFEYMRGLEVRARCLSQ